MPRKVEWVEPTLPPSLNQCSRCGAVNPKEPCFVERCPWEPARDKGVKR